MDPKKELASIIELTGEMPEPGEGFKATKDGNQYELPWREAYAAMTHAMECEEYMEVTPMTLKYKNGQQARILQNPVNKTIVLIDVSIHVPARGTTAIIHKFPLCFLLLPMQLYQ